MKTEYDVAVIGGGINGAGIARDAALRGLSVVLLEKNDFGSGTSSWSSRLIHGGLRYLEYGEIPLVFESLHERRRLREVASHLVDRIKLSIPIYENGRRSKTIIRLGMIAYDLLSIRKKLPRHRILSREEIMSEVPGLMCEGLLGAAQYYDAQVTYAERLVLENIIAAKEAGAHVRNHSPVIGINVRAGSVHSLHFIDQESGDETEIGARIVINAAGPWVDRVLATVNREMPKFMGGTKGSHIVVGAFEGAPTAAFYVEAQADGRPFFIIPWNSQFLIGTTDIRYEGEPSDVVATAEEIQYLLDETNRVFPSANLTTESIHFAYAGVRPLPKRDKGPESAITRKHIILKHKKQGRGLVSIIGGKLTTYRNLAEQAVDATLRLLQTDSIPCQTRSAPLPGSVNLGQARMELTAAEDLSAFCADRLISIYGARALDIVKTASRAKSPDFIDDAETILEAEVAYAFRHEMAVTLTDIIHRRMMLGLTADQGESLSGRISELAAKEMGWSKKDTERELNSLRQYNARFLPD